MIIREEMVSDIEAIAEVTVAAFESHQFSRTPEQYIIYALRESGMLAVSLVAELDGRVVGHIAFSPVEISDNSKGWYGLGPVSVLPDFQKQGIGSALVNEGLSILKGIGGKGCVLVGEKGYYGRFGFRNYPCLCLNDVPQEVFLALPFEGEVPEGEVEFHEGFRAES